MSVDNYDAFGDIRGQYGGVFGAEQAALQPGLKKHRQVHAQPTAGGLVLQFECQVCGQPTHLEVEYPELVAIKYGVNPMVAFRSHPQLLQSPTRWQFRPEENGWRPEIHCHGSCNNAKVDVLIEPHEPERFLAAARRKGFINPQGEAQISNLCAQMAKAGQAVRR